MPIRLDLNNPVFQEQWFSLGKEDRLAVLVACRGKLASKDWNTLYGDQGLRWELIQSRTGAGNERLYSIRITQRIRAVVKRSGDFLEFLTLHAGHD